MRIGFQRRILSPNWVLLCCTEPLAAEATRLSRCEALRKAVSHWTNNLVFISIDFIRCCQLANSPVTASRYSLVAPRDRVSSQRSNSRLSAGCIRSTQELVAKSLKILRFQGLKGTVAEKAVCSRNSDSVLYMKSSFVALCHDHTIFFELVLNTLNLTISTSHPRVISPAYISVADFVAYLLSRTI